MFVVKVVCRSLDDATRFCHSVINSFADVSSKASGAQVGQQHGRTNETNI